MERSNCFDIINSFYSTGTLNKLKITITISFAKIPYNISNYVLTGRFKSSCYCNTYQYSDIITVNAENATINARSMKLCL